MYVAVLVAAQARTQGSPTPTPALIRCGFKLLGSFLEQWGASTFSSPQISPLKETGLGTREPGAREASVAAAAAAAASAWRAGGGRFPPRAWS